MDQRCGFERLTKSVINKFPSCKFAQLVVNQRQELARGALVALFDCGNNSGDVGHRRVLCSLHV